MSADLTADTHTHTHTLSASSIYHRLLHSNNVSGANKVCSNGGILSLMLSRNKSGLQILAYNKLYDYIRNTIVLNCFQNHLITTART